MRKKIRIQPNQRSEGQGNCRRQALPGDPSKDQKEKDKRGDTYLLHWLKIESGKKVHRCQQQWQARWIRGGTDDISLRDEADISVWPVFNDIPGVHDVKGFIA